jgi:hypothetical protein
MKRPGVKKNNNKKIEEEEDENKDVASYFDIFNVHTPATAMVWILLLAVFAVIVVVIAAVPNYSGGTPANIAPTRTYPPLSTTTAPPITNTTTTIITTTPIPSLILTCPTNDVMLPLGYPLNNISIGGVTLTGGCDPNSLTYIDTYVGSIAKRTIPSPKGKMFDSSHLFQNITSGKVVQGFNHLSSKGSRCGVVIRQKKKNSWESSLKTSGNSRSITFPDSQMTVSFPTILSNTGALQPNFCIDTNINLVVISTDSQFFGSTIRVYTKSIVELSGSPFQLSSLAPISSPCYGTGAGKAQVIFDTFASIWLFLEASTYNQTLFCLYASDGSSPLLSTYTLYPLYFPTLDGIPVSFPKLAVFNGHYTMSFLYNDTTSMLVFIDRDPIITQQISTSYFSVFPGLPDLVGYSVSTWTPLENRGELPVPPLVFGNKVFFMRQRDNSLDPAAPLPVQDYLDILEYSNINFNTGNATLVSYSLAITNFDASGSSNCIAVPNSNTTFLYSGKEWLGGRLAFNALVNPYLGEYRVVGTFVTEACIGGRIQWFELEWSTSSSQWIVRQQGVSLETPPEQYLWMPAISQDKYGNMVLIYSNSSLTSLGYYPSLGAFSRSADDPLNIMRYATGSLVWGQGQSPSPLLDNWGYTSMIIPDPAQPPGRSFYVIGSYSPGTVNVWQGLAAYIRIKGEIVQRNILAEDVCGQVQTCEFFILSGN